MLNLRVKSGVSFLRAILNISLTEKEHKLFPGIRFLREKTITSINLENAAKHGYVLFNRGTYLYANRLQ